MISKFSKVIISLKHWQLLLLIIFPLAWTSPNPLKEIINGVGVLFLTFWIYGIGIYGYDRLQKTNKTNSLRVNLFKKNMLMSILLLIVIYIISKLDESGCLIKSVSAIIIMPIGGYFIYSISYTIIFATKSVTMLELKREVTFTDYFLNLFLILNLIIGIWFIQPKIRKYILSDIDPTI